MVFADIGWLNNSDIDINGDGERDNVDLTNKYWKEQNARIIKIRQNQK